MKKFVWICEEDKREIEKTIGRLEQPYVENQNYIQIVHSLSSKYHFRSIFSKLFHFRKYKEYCETLHLIHNDEKSFERAQESAEMLKDIYSNLLLIEQRYNRIVFSSNYAFSEYYYHLFQRQFDTYGDLVQKCIVFFELPMAQRRAIFKSSDYLENYFSIAHHAMNYRPVETETLTYEMYEKVKNFSSLKDILEYSLMNEFSYQDYKTLVDCYFNVLYQREQYEKSLELEDKDLGQSLRTLPAYLINKDIRHMDLFDQKTLLEVRRELLLQALKEDTVDQISTLNTISSINQLLLKKENLQK